MIPVLILGALVAVAAASVRLVNRDLRALHRSGKNLTDRPVDANGVSPAGITVVGNNITH